MQGPDKRTGTRDKASGGGAKAGRGGGGAMRRVTTQNRTRPAGRYCNKSGLF